MNDELCPLDHDHDRLPCPTDDVQPILNDDLYTYTYTKVVTHRDGERLVHYHGVATPRVVSAS